MRSGLLVSIDRLLKSIADDNGRHGGLLTRQTIHMSDELRVLLARERRQRGEPEPPDPVLPRQPGGPL